VRLYLDQMLRVELAERLRQLGHDVVRVSERGQATVDDQEILDTAISEHRTLVTLDEHFGDWTVLPLSEHPGVVRLKIDPTTSQNAAGLLEPFLSCHRQEDLRDHLVIISRTGERWIRTSPTE